MEKLTPAELEAIERGKAAEALESAKSRMPLSEAFRLVAAVTPGPAQAASHQ